MWTITWSSRRTCSKITSRREYQAKAPKVSRLSSGCDVWEFNGQKLPNIGLNAVVGRVPEEYGVEPTSYDQLRKGCYDVHARVADMNANGVLGSICFPSFPGFVGQLWSSCEDKTLARVMLQAYNDWHIDEWAGSYPDRFIPLSHAGDLGSAADGRGSAAGGEERLQGRQFYRDSGQAAPAEHTLRALGAVLAGLCRRGHDDPDPYRLRGRYGVPHHGITGGGDDQLPPRSASSTVAADLLFSTLLRKYPTLKFALSEGGIGWVPYFLERADYTYNHHHAWTHQDFGDKMPSEVFREHILQLLHRRQGRHQDARPDRR